MYLFLKKIWNKNFYILLILVATIVFRDYLRFAVSYIFYLPGVVKREGENYKKENLYLKKILIKQQEKILSLQRKLRFYQKLEKIQKKICFCFPLKAKVLWRSYDCFFDVIGIDRGYKDGVSKEDSIINEYGVVGIITKVSAHVSEGITIVHPKFRTAAKILRSGKEGILIGGVEFSLVKNICCKLLYIYQTHPYSEPPVRVGDVVITSEDNLIFPSGLMLGYVIKCYKKKESPFYEVFVEPAIDLNTIDNLIILRCKKKIR